MGRDMVKTNLKIKNNESKANLKVVNKDSVKTTSYSDINLKAWREYEHVKTDTLWEFPNRLKEGGHSHNVSVFTCSYSLQALRLISL